MAAFNLDTRVSVMDIVALLGAGTTALWVVFSQGADITQVELNQRHLGEEIRRIDNSAKERSDNILKTVEKQLDNQAEQMGEQKRATEKGFDRIDRKLDQLIDREIRRNGSP